MATTNAEQQKASVISPQKGKTDQKQQVSTNSDKSTKKDASNVNKGPSGENL